MKKLRTKFFVFILTPVVLVILLAGAGAYLVSRHIVMEQLWTLGIQELQQAADEVDATIGTGIQTLQIMSIHEAMVHNSEKDLKNSFSELAKKLPVEGIILATLSGKYISSFQGSLPKEYSPIFDQWFLDALDSNEPIITPPMISPFSGEEVIIVATKVVDGEGRVTGVLAYSLPLNSLRERIPRLAALEHKQEFKFSIFVRDGSFLMHTNSGKVGKKLGSSNDDLHISMREALSQERPIWYGVGKIGSESYFGGYQKSRYGEIYVGLEIPLWVGMHPILILSGSYIALGIVCVLVLTIMLTLLAARIARPINMLSDAAEKFTKGETGEKLPVITKDELGHLTETFNEMLEGIRQRDLIRDTFGRYVTPEIAHQVLESEDGLKIGGESRNISLMMADLRGFTAQTADMDPTKVLHMLNRYLGKMVEIIIKNQGIVDEMQGDGILAFFGAPVPLKDHPARAVACAVEMQRALKEVNVLNASEGLPLLKMGIGINTAEVVVGNIGSEKRTKYGVVGSAVNFTGRIESFTLGGQILIGRSTYETIEDIVDVQKILTVEMKGFKGEVELFDVKGIRGDHNLHLEDNEESFRVLTIGLPVAAYRVQAKTVSQDAVTATITQLSIDSAVLSSDSSMEAGTEIRLDPMDPDFMHKGIEAFGKITSVREENGRYVWVLTFTFLSHEALNLLKHFLNS